MEALTHHWTARSTDDFMYRLGADFMSRIENLLGDQSKATLAKKLNVSPGRISQILNNPGNLTLRTIIELVRALGLKISIVAYDDDDPKNVNGPVDAEIFEQCWIKCGKPTDFHALKDNKQIPVQHYFVLKPYAERVEGSLSFQKHISSISDTAANTEGKPTFLRGEGGIWPSQRNSFLLTKK
jgi:transcriptional regulator with XRE-family HTH domain